MIYMPIFEFKCGDCGHVFEDLVLVCKDVNEVICPVCKSSNTSKLISKFGYSSSSGFVSSSRSGCNCGSCNSGSCSGCGQK